MSPFPEQHGRNVSVLIREELKSKSSKALERKSSNGYCVTSSEEKSSNGHDLESSNGNDVKAHTSPEIPANGVDAIADVENEKADKIMELTTPSSLIRFKTLFKVT